MVYARESQRGASQFFFIKEVRMNEVKKKQTLEEKWQNATLANNFIFYKIIRRDKPAVLL